MTLPVLDTSALVDLDRSDNRVAEILAKSVDADEEIIVPVQTAIEYCAGRFDPAQGMRALHASFWVVACDDDIALTASRLARKAQSAGNFPGWADLQIAATAKQAGMPVVTRNAKHFRPLGIQVIDH